MGGGEGLGGVRGGRWCWGGGGGGGGVTFHRDILIILSMTRQNKTKMCFHITRWTSWVCTLLNSKLTDTNVNIYTIPNIHTLTRQKRTAFYPSAQPRYHWWFRKCILRYQTAAINVTFETYNRFPDAECVGKGPQWSMTYCARIATSSALSVTSTSTGHICVIMGMTSSSGDSYHKSTHIICRLLNGPASIAVCNDSRG